MRPMATEDASAGAALKALSPWSVPWLKMTLPPMTGTPLVQFGTRLQR